MESLGYRVLTAVDGREALERYRSGERVDLVITDVVMPEMGGRELIEELRKITPDVKVVAMTGYTLPQDLRKLKGKERLKVIHKPLDTHVLARAVRQALDENGWT